MPGVEPPPVAPVTPAVGAKLRGVDRVQEIEAAINGLPPEDFRRIAQWFPTLEQTRWNERMDRDSSAGKLDFLFGEAGSEAAPGLLRQRWRSSPGTR
jgi:hypothetical protein